MRRVATQQVKTTGDGAAQIFRLEQHGVAEPRRARRAVCVLRQRHARRAARRSRRQGHHACEHAIEALQNSDGVIGARHAFRDHRAGCGIAERDRRHASGKESAKKCAFVRAAVVKDADRAAACRRFAIAEVNQPVRDIAVAVGQRQVLRLQAIDQLGAADAMAQPFEVEQKLDRCRRFRPRLTADHRYLGAEIVRQPCRKFLMEAARPRGIDAQGDAPWDPCFSRRRAADVHLWTSATSRRRGFHRLGAARYCKMLQDTPLMRLIALSG